MWTFWVKPVSLLYELQILWGWGNLKSLHLDKKKPRGRMNIFALRDVKCALLILNYKPSPSRSAWSTIIYETNGYPMPSAMRFVCMLTMGQHTEITSDLLLYRWRYYALVWWPAFVVCLFGGDGGSGANGLVNEARTLSYTQPMSRSLWWCLCREKR